MSTGLTNFVNMAELKIMIGRWKDFPTKVLIFSNRRNFLNFGHKEAGSVNIDELLIIQSINLYIFLKVVWYYSMWTEVI